MAEMVQEKTGAENVLWDLGPLYKGMDDPAIEQDFAEIGPRADKFAEKYRGRVASLNAQELAQALTETEDLMETIWRLDSYAGLQWTTDTANPAFGALMQRVQEVGAQIQQKTLFFDLEWANVPDDHVKIADDAALARWRHYLLKILESRPHLLSEPEEKILSEKAVTGTHAWTRLFQELFGAATYNLKGQKVPFDVIARQLYAPEREDRKAAADSITEGLKGTLRTSTYIFNTLAADKASDDRLRKYASWISSRNLSNETSDEAVEALVEAVTARYDIVARYYTLKRKLLGLDELTEYDRYAPLTNADSRYTWDQARETVLSAYAAFHPTMAEIAAEFFDKNWIHAPTLPGKRGGAFASPTIPSAHPYVFVNFTGLGRDVATLAHELGHGIHMYLSRSRGILEAGTPLTTAEMASVFGEMLVFNDMMNRETDKQVKISMLAKKIEDSFSTVFRQISMNRFENLMHNARRNEGELSSDRISELWMESQRAMFGDSLKLRDEYSTWWSYIPHFISTPGYVYAYAFGELLVRALFTQYQKEGASFAPKYLEVLSAGGADRPENIMKIVGVDLNDPNFWKQGVETIDDMVKQLETLVNEK